LFATAVYRRLAPWRSTQQLCQSIQTLKHLKESAMKTNTLVNLIAAVDFAFLLVAAVTLILTVDMFQTTTVGVSVNPHSTQHDRYE
jgi:hypothetical protein